MIWQKVIKFWFDEIEPVYWFKKNREFDLKIIETFQNYYQAAANGELYQWRGEPKGRLAEIIILDQFSRNMFRDSAQAFATDGMALILAQEAIGNGAVDQLSLVERKFLYMPFMHAESKLMQSLSVEYFSVKGLEANLPFAEQHKFIIDRFGRFPHRNAILGRKSTEAEIEFLKQPGSSF